MPYLGQSPSKGDENNFKILDDISSYTLTFDGSDSSVVSAANDTITSLTHRFVQGQRVTYTDGDGSAIAGLTDATVYFIIKEDHNTIKLATSASNAANGTAVNITNVGSGSSHTLNVAFDGVNTKFKATHTNGQKAKITRSAQLVISINGVIQQPHDTASPTTGFGFDLDGTIVFSQAPVSSDIFWAHVLTNNNVTFDISDNDIDNFTGDGSTVAFNLSKTPPDNRNILVTVDGVVQYPNDPDGTVRSYNVVENVLTFAVAPLLDVQIQVRHIGFAGSTSGGGGGVTNFYGRTGSVVLKNTDNITVNDAAITGNATVTGDLIVNGTTTTLDTNLIDVDKIEVTTESTNIAVAVTHNGSGDLVRLYDGSSQVVTVDDEGNVGIGTDSPDAQLHVMGQIKVDSSNYARVLYARDDTNLWSVGLRHTDDFWFFRENGNANVIFQHGKVGILTTSPTAQLSIGNTTSGYINATGIQINRPHQYGLQLGVHAYTDISYNQSADYYAAAFKATAPGGIAVGVSTDANSDGLGGTLNARIDFDGDSYFAGNMGIGTAAPGYKLELHALGGSTNLKIGSRMTDNDYGIAFGYFDESAGKHGFGIDRKHGGTTTSNGFVFRADTGRVGINTDSPESLLHINGAGGGNASGLTFKNSFDLVAQYFVNDSDNSDFLITYSGTGGAELTLKSDGKLALNESNGDDVLIGTSSVLDNAKLTVAKSSVGLATAITLHNASGSGSKISSSKALVLAADYDSNSGTDGSLIAFETDGTEKVRIESGGRLLIGHDSSSGDFHGPQTTNNRNPYFQLHGENASSAGAALVSWSASSGQYYSPVLYLGRSGSGTKGTNGLIPNQTFGSIVFSGDDGGDFVKGAMIVADVDGIAGINSMPGRLEFYTTASGAQTPEERLRINSDGVVIINQTTASGTKLAIQSTDSSGSGTATGIRVGNNIGVLSQYPANIEVRTTGVSTYNAIRTDAGDGNGGFTCGVESYNGFLDLTTGGSNDIRVKLRSSGDSYFNGGKVGIGTNIPYATLLTVGHPDGVAAGSVFTSAPLNVFAAGNLGGTSGDAHKIAIFGGRSTGNASGLSIYHYRRENGTSWTTDGFSFRQEVDNTSNIYDYLNFSQNRIGFGEAQPTRKFSYAYTEGANFSSTNAAYEFLLWNKADISSYATCGSSIQLRAGNTSAGGGNITGVRLGPANQGDLVFSTTDVNGSPVEKLRIHSGGLVEANSSFSDTYSTTTSISPHFRARNQQGADDIYGGIQLRADRSNGAAAIFNIACLNSSTNYASTLVFQSRRTDGNFSEKVRITSDNVPTLLIGQTTANADANGWTLRGDIHTSTCKFTSTDVRTMMDYSSYYSTGSQESKVSIHSTGMINSRYGTALVLYSCERRTKKNIVDLDKTKAWNTLRDTPMYSWNYKKEAEGTKKHYGPIVDECPEDIIIPGIEEDEEGIINTVDSDKLQYRAYTALSEALKRIETLEAKVAALEGS